MELSTTAQSTEAGGPFLKASEAVDHCYGSICCLIFLIGTLGNIVSFLYFKSKKRDISSVIYMLITANDIVVSITVLPVGISFLTQGQPGLIFGNKYGCEAWYHISNTALRLSMFLVLCLCITRTISMLVPFSRQKIKYVVITVVSYLVINLAFEATILSLDSTAVGFLHLIFRCDLGIIIEHVSSAEYIVNAVKNNIFYTAPALVVAINCVISVVVLTRRNRNVQQRELQQSRNRATATILLFALLYGVCNIPLALNLMINTISVATENLEIGYNLFKFDKHLYYMNATFTLLPAANSAANPILYFWRMPALREYIMSGIRRMLGLNREVRRPAVQQAVTQPCNRVLENINIAQRLPASGHLEIVL